MGLGDDVLVNGFGPVGHQDTRVLIDGCWAVGGLPSRARHDGVEQIVGGLSHPLALVRLVVDGEVVPPLAHQGGGDVHQGEAAEIVEEKVGRHLTVLLFSGLVDGFAVGLPPVLRPVVGEVG